MQNSMQVVQHAEPEFMQAYNEIKSAIQPFLEKNPEYIKALEAAASECRQVFKPVKIYKVLIKNITVPERVVQFRVMWESDSGECQINTGYRVQFSSALGPYKGGLRLHPSVNLSILKFLGFEQTFKNALTGLNMGGGKGGCDFDPKGKSDSEIRRFCCAFMGELQRHIGQDTDVPAGDIGVGGREIGFLFGAYKKMRNEWTGVLTGKGLNWGGSNIRAEATGWGLCYFVEHMIRDAGAGSFKGKKVLISGSGNVAQFAALKVIELGGTVLSLSDSQGSMIASDGFSIEAIKHIGELKLKHKSLHALLTEQSALSSKYKWHKDARPWTLVAQADIALPSATQNEVNGEEAEALVKAGVKFVAEGSNMGSTQEAIAVFERNRAKATSCENTVFYAPGKAANCGGVAVSGLEMAQNSQRIQWTNKEVDQKLQAIMKHVYDSCFTTGKEYTPSGALPSLVIGANICGFKKVADAMKDHGDWF